MKHHDATLDEWEIAEEDSVDDDDKGQDGEGNQRDLPIRRGKGRVAQIGESNDLLACCL